MHYIEVYFCQQSEFGVSADSSNKKFGLSNNWQQFEISVWGDLQRLDVLLTENWVESDWILGSDFSIPLKKNIIGFVHYTLKDLF